MDVKLEDGTDFGETLREWGKEREIRDSKFPYKQLNKVFPKGIFSYNAVYAFTHPWIIIEGISNEIKWAWQRVFHQYDERVVWSIDMWLIPKIAEWLEKLKKDKHGIPMCMFEDGEWGEVSKDAEEAAQKKYYKILDEIIEGCKLYDDGDFFNRPDDKVKFDNAMKLFVEYLGTFWDQGIVEFYLTFDSFCGSINIYQKGVK